MSQGLFRSRPVSLLGFLPLSPHVKQETSGLLDQVLFHGSPRANLGSQDTFLEAHAFEFIRLEFMQQGET